MAINMNITEKFELSDGMTILACSGYDQKLDVIGKQLYLISSDDEIRQTLTISGERKMLNQKANFDRRAFEISSVVELSSEEARSGNWKLVDEHLSAANR